MVFLKKLMYIDSSPDNFFCGKNFRVFFFLSKGTHSGGFICFVAGKSKLFWKLDHFVFSSQKSITVGFIKFKVHQLKQGKW